MAYIYGSTAQCKVANGQTRDEYECRLGYQVNSQNIESNTSNITLRLEVRSTSKSYSTYGYNQTTKIDGTTLAAKSFDMRDTNTWKIFGERTITISHSSDGTYSASKNASFTTTASSGYSLKSGSASVTVKPSTIPRASEPTFSSSSVEMGSAVTINTNRKSSNFTHTITYSFNSATETIGTGVGASVSWTPSLSLASQIPNAISGTCTITCKTYNGSTLVGTKTVNLTLKVPSSVVPSISSVALSEANTSVSSLGVYVQNKSQLKVVTTASGSYGSTIKSYKITGIDNNTYNSNNFTSNVLTQSGNKTITVNVTDSRGRTATKTITYTCVAYNNPSISNISVARCNSDGTNNEDGIYLKYTFVGSVSSINNKNTYVYKIGYKLTDSSSYTYVTISNNAYTINKTNTVLTGVTFDNNYSYDIIFSITDKFTTTIRTADIRTGFELINFNENGKSMAIGKVSEAGGNEKKLEIALPTEFNQDTYIRNNKANTNTGFYTKRTDSNTEVWMGVGAGGINHGLYSTSLDKWLVHSDKEHVFFDNVMWDMSTENKVDTWVPVLANGKLQHRVIHKDINNLVPKVLYSNISGTSGTATLSATTEGWKNIRIIYKNNDGQWGSTTINGDFGGYSVNGKILHGSVIRKNESNTAIMISSALFKINGTTITTERNSQANINFGGSTNNDDNKLLILRVEVWN